MSKKILFIVNHRKERSPGQRFRFEQYLDYLKERGFEYEISNLLNEKGDKAFYSNNYLKKIWIGIKAWLKRYIELRSINKYDIVFVFREAFFTGSTFFEKKYKQGNVKLIFDFDDAIWIDVGTSSGNKYLSWLKNPSKTKEIVAMSDLIIAGNKYLADYASTFNNNIKIIPTTIDTDKYIPPKKRNSDKICIGWSGSFSTIQHFEHAITPLKAVKEKYDYVEFKVIGDGNYKNKELGINGLPWRAESEVKDISSFDIGIMPLPDEEWTKGKCGLKGLQYMALEVPTIMSPVGVNTEIISDGKNGFLAKDDDEWFEILCNLIESAELRQRIGKAGRETVVKEFSVQANKEKYLEIFEELTQ